jgi:hypothetical protein
VSCGTCTEGGGVGRSLATCMWMGIRSKAWRMRLTPAEITAQGVLRLVSLLSLVEGAVLLAVALIGRRTRQASEIASPAS